MKTVKTILAIALLTGTIGMAQSQNKPTTGTGSEATAGMPAGYHLLKKTVVGGEGKWDYLTVDSESGRLYLSHTNQVEVLDLKTHAKVGIIPNTKGVHGIAVVPKLNRGFTTNGKSNTVTMFDLKTLKPLGEIATGLKPDALLYDKFSGRVFIFNNDGASATVLEAASGKVVGTVELGGAPEAGASDENGMIFVNLEDKNEIVAFDARSLSVKNRWKLGPGEEPTGLALDRQHHRLFSVCHNQLMMVLDSENGTIVAQLPIGGGVDGVVFDAATQLAVCSNGEGSLTVVGEATPTSFKVIETVVTEPGAKTIALDPQSHHLFVSTAQYGPAPAPTVTETKPKPSIIPGSFMVLEYGR